MNRKKTLVIDDEQIVLDSVGKILTNENYDVEATLSGKEGVNLALNHHYDLVLTDVRMPDMGGMLVLRDIKRAKPTLPVVMITGYATIKSAVQAMRLGASDYIEKPFTPDELLQSVERAFESTATRPPEEQSLIHKEEILAVLERAATETDFVYDLLHNWADALEEYNLTGPEKLALLTGDVEWVEKYMGPLTPMQKKWLEMPMGIHMLTTFNFL